MKRIRIGGLVGTATAGAWAVAWAQTEPPWQSMVLVVTVAGLVLVILLYMMFRLIDLLTARRYTVKGPGDVVLEPPSEPVSPEPVPVKPKSWLPRKPPPDA